MQARANAAYASRGCIALHQVNRTRSSRASGGLFYQPKLPIKTMHYIELLRHILLSGTTRGSGSRGGDETRSAETAATSLEFSKHLHALGLRHQLQFS